jgi:hypothetical protein
MCKYRCRAELRRSMVAASLVGWGMHKYRVGNEAARTVGEMRTQTGRRVPKTAGPRGRRQ